MESHGLLQANDEIELPNTVDGVADVVKMVLSKPFVDQIILRQGKAVVQWRRHPSDTLLEPDVDDDPSVVLDRISLSEIPEYQDPSTMFLTAQGILAEDGFAVTHVFCQGRKTLGKWLGIDEWRLPHKHIPSGLWEVCGLYIVETPEVPDHTIVVCGSAFRGHKLAHIKKGVKITIKDKADKERDNE